MNFEIELVDMYPMMSETEKKKKARFDECKHFSCHVYIAIFDIDIRGVIAKKNPEDWFVSMPHNRNYDKESKKLIIFPILEFTNPRKKKDFIMQLKEKIVDFYNQKLIEEKGKEISCKRLRSPEIKKKLQRLSFKQNPTDATHD